MATKQVKYAVVDAFTDSAFKGNPAAVCILDEERDQRWLQLVASEFNFSQTGYLTRIAPDPDANSSSNPRFRLRWFTPVAEVKLCGHATLAAAHYCFTSGLVNDIKVEFLTHSGVLNAEKLVGVEKPSTLNKGQENETDLKFLIELNFPPVPLVDYNEEVLLISEALNGVSMIDVKRTSWDDLFVVLPSVEAVVGFQPDSEKIRRCPGRGLLISALAPPDSEFDFFSRFFCPKMGFAEDPVCGSAHCALAVYWSKKLGKCDFLAYAASPRSGVVKLRVDEKNNRIKLQGKAVTVMEGSIVV